MIIQAAVSDNVQECSEAAGLADAWAFVDRHIRSSETSRTIVPKDYTGGCYCEIWEGSRYLP